MEELKVLDLEWKHQIQNGRVGNTRFRMEELVVLHLEWKNRKYWIYNRSVGSTRSRMEELKVLVGLEWKNQNGRVENIRFRAKEFRLKVQIQNGRVRMEELKVLVLES